MKKIILVISVLFFLSFFIYSVDAITWISCANEGGTCSFTGTNQVRYGGSDSTGGHYVFKTVTNGTPCTNSAFGSDPWPGHSKNCWYSEGLQNPLGDTDTVAGVIAKIMKGLLPIAISVASIFILWGAFQILFSAGEAEKINKGKKTILYAIIGLVLMVLASSIGAVIINILDVETP